MREQSTYLDAGVGRDVEGGRAGGTRAYRSYFNKLNESKDEKGLTVSTRAIAAIVITEASGHRERVAGGRKP
jgi:hypothetical protein